MKILALLTHFFAFGILAQLNPSDDFNHLPQLPVNSFESMSSFVINSDFSNKGLAKTRTARGKNRADGWFSFIATSKIIQVSIKTDKISNLGVFESFATNEVASKMTSKNKKTALVLNTTIGNEYFIQIQRREGSKSMSLHGEIAVFNIDPPNFDEPCGAQDLMVNSTAIYSSHSTKLATASKDIVAGSCALYNGEDVWFKITVPSSGNIKVKCKPGTLVDGSMALYKGNCTSLNFLACNDDSSSDLMPEITAVNLTPGETIYIRFWDYGNNNHGSFNIATTSEVGVVYVKN